MQKPKNTREWLIHITDQINMFRNWKEQEGLVNHLIANDVVPVVRCKDCIHCEHILDEFCKHWYQCKRKGNFAQKKADDYCSYGERKADNAN